MNDVLEVELTFPDGRQERFSVEGERIRIGSAAYCDVRLAPGDAAAEQLALEWRGQELYAESLVVSPPTTLNGQALTLAPLGPNDVLELSGVRLRVLHDAARASSKAEAKAGKGRMLLAVTLGLGVPALAATLPLGAGEAELSDTKRAPALFASGSLTCTQAEPQSALAFAHEELGVADAKHERRPFHAEDGVKAVESYRLAAACFRSAGSADEATAVDARARELERELDESYRTHRVRLEHALSIKNYLVARKETRALLALTQGQSGEYVTWLSSLERRIRMKQEKDK
ncbi:MAG: FHA domain-containing protein [Polyangiaceae bacterium]